jgi:N-acetylglucosamine kinase-like BadF-type ATPase
MGYFLGVDVGNTKSHALIVDATGQAVGFAKTGPGNHEVLGAEGFGQILHEVVWNSLRDARIEIAEIAGAGFGIAGFDWPSDRALMDRMIGAVGMGAPYEVVNDGMIGLFAGATRNWGVVVSAGTSSNAHGRNPDGKIGRMTGNGLLFGECGGGHELVERAVAGISRAWSKRGPETMLSQMFVEKTGAASLEDFLEGLARERYILQATDAPLVFEAARQGDPVASSTIRWAAEGLADLAVGIIRQLGLEDQAFDVVLAGSFYNGSPLIADTMREIIHDVAPAAKLIRLNAPPVVGAVMLGMEQAGLDYNDLRGRIIDSTVGLLAG